MHSDEAQDALVHPDEAQYAPVLPNEPLHLPSFNGHYQFDYGDLDIESKNMIIDGNRMVKITVCFNGTRFNQLPRTITEAQVFGLEEEHNMVHFVSRALEAFFTEDFLYVFRYQH